MLLKIKFKISNSQRSWHIDVDKNIAEIFQTSDGGQI